MWHSVKFRSVVELWNWWYGSWTDSGQTISGNFKPTLRHWNASIAATHGANWKRWMRSQFIPSGAKTMVHAVPGQFDADRYYVAAQDIPHLVIRYEDILFQPERLINRLCRCVKGYVRPGGVVIQESASKGHGAARGRQQALETYGDPQYRLKGYPEEDVQLMKDTLNQTLLQFFSYQV